jgi:uncharacterized cupredoxin-like copper-binding protein
VAGIFELQEIHMKTFHIIAACAACVGASLALAHGSGEHAGHGGGAASASAAQMTWGTAGQASQASRTITLRMTDDMRFTPAHLQIRRGETLRLRIENQGRILHEIVLGTPATLDEHAAAMLKHPGMAHDTPYTAHVAPGQQGDLVWNFNRAGEFDFACLVAGHYQAGMRGTIRVTP